MGFFHYCYEKKIQTENVLWLHKQKQSNGVSPDLIIFQVFVFSLRPQNEDWQFYDWDKVTTVVMVGYLDMKVVCKAHEFGARAITIGA